MTRVGFLHTAQVHVATFTRLLGEQDPTAVGRHVVDESLLANARAHGMDDPLRMRVLAHLRSLAPDVDAVLCTCSTIGGAAESLASDAGVPVVRIDRPMARQAVTSGTRIGVVSAVESTIEPTLALLRQEAAAAGATVELVTLPCPDAWTHFESGDHDAYLDAVAHHVDTLAGDVDVVVLAQASMADASKRCRSDIPILSSPASGVAAVLAT